MLVTYRKKIVKEINSIKDMEDFVINESLYNNFKSFNPKHHQKILDKILGTKSISYKQVKPFIKEFLGGESNRNINFWLCRGYNIDEANKIIKELQTSSAKKVDCSKRLLPSNTEYWTKLGHTLDEAKIKVKQVQTTFSKDKCIEKYGLELGLKKFKERQEKWRKSISNFNGDMNHDSSSLDFFINKFKDEWVVNCLSKLSYTEHNRNVLLNILEKCITLDDLGNYVKDNVDVKNITDISFIFNSKVLQNFFKTDSQTIKNIILNKLGVVQTKFSNFWIYSEHLFNSNGELEIGIFLTENNIDFIHNNKYPNSNFRYDFFLPKHDLYVEYFGLIKNDGWISNKILTDYEEKMFKKILFCEKNKLNLIHSTDYKKIIDNIKQII